MEYIKHKIKWCLDGIFVFLLACNRGGGRVAHEKTLETIDINAHNADKRLYC